jgi:hypothetical protein
MLVPPRKHISPLVSREPIVISSGNEMKRTKFRVTKLAVGSRQHLVTIVI